MKKAKIRDIEWNDLPSYLEKQQDRETKFWFFISLAALIATSGIALMIYMLN